jgi:hypothetical protein
MKFSPIPNNLAWSDDSFNKSGKSDEDRVAEVVKKVINDLPSLQHLQLGYCCLPLGGNGVWLPDIWGEALKYVRLWRHGISDG